MSHQPANELVVRACIIWRAAKRAIYTWRAGGVAGNCEWIGNRRELSQIRHSPTLCTSRLIDILTYNEAAGQRVRHEPAARVAALHALQWGRTLGDLRKIRQITEISNWREFRRVALVGAGELELQCAELEPDDNGLDTSSLSLRVAARGTGREWESDSLASQWWSETGEPTWRGKRSIRARVCVRPSYILHIYIYRRAAVVCI